MSEFSSLLLPDFFLNELRINYILLSVVAKSAGPIRDRQGISYRPCHFWLFDLEEVIYSSKPQSSPLENGIIIVLTS